MNIVFICVDCLREDILRRSRTDTPFIDMLRTNGTYFSNLFATTSTTTPSVASIMTGLYSESNGVVSLQRGELRPSV
ncbi:MAG: alkaline phosphatase family protein, partial [Halobacteriaceae archaeon]